MLAPRVSTSLSSYRGGAHLSHASPPRRVSAATMGYAGYVPAKIAQFEFTPLEQARLPPLHPARF